MKRGPRPKKLERRQEKIAEEVTLRLENKTLREVRAVVDELIGRRGEDAVLEIFSYGHDNPSELHVTWFVPESDEDLAARQQNENERVARKRALDAAEYARLKKIFGD